MGPWGVMAEEAPAPRLASPAQGLTLVRRNQMRAISGHYRSVEAAAVLGAPVSADLVADTEALRQLAENLPRLFQFARRGPASGERSPPSGKSPVCLLSTSRVSNRPRVFCTPPCRRTIATRSPVQSTRPATSASPATSTTGGRKADPAQRAAVGAESTESTGTSLVRERRVWHCHQAIEPYSSGSSPVALASS